MRTVGRVTLRCDYSVFAAGWPLILAAVRPPSQGRHGTVPI